MLTDETRVQIGRAMAAMAVMGAFGSTVALWVDGHGIWPFQTGGLVALAVGYGALAWTVLPAEPRNGSIWALTGSAFLAGIGAASVTARILLDSVPNDFDAFLGTSASELPLMAAILVWPGRWTWVPAVFLVSTIGMMRFPDGRLQTQRWRWPARLSAVAMAVPAVTIAVLYFPTSTFTYDSAAGPAAEIIQGSGLLACLVLTWTAFAGLLLRYRRSSAEVRSQIRVVVFGVLCSVVFGGAGLVVDLVVTGDAVGVGAEVGDIVLTDLLQIGGLGLLIGSFAVAIRKYRLYDVDVIISKSVAYLGLAAAITAVYVVVAVVPLLVLGLPDEGGLGLVLPLAATAVVALLFEPIRSKVQLGANRLVYGRRATPHDVLSQLTAKLADSTGDTTSELARLLAEGTGAEQSVVWLRVGETLHPDGVWSTEGSSPPAPRPADSLIDGESRAVRAVRHGDRELGAVSMTKSRRDPITEADTALLADVAAGSGLVLRNIGLSTQLERRADDVRASRRRLIEARDAERHRLERDLHDGAQQHVVALRVKLGVARAMADKAGEGEIAASIAGLTDAAQEAVDGLRAIAHGIYPPLLEAEGLEPALRSIADSAAAPVAITVSVDGRYPPPVEQTVYFCVLEIVGRAIRSGATAVSVVVDGSEQHIELTTDHNAAADRLAMTAVADRVDAADGVLQITPNLVRVSLPARQLEPT